MKTPIKAIQKRIDSIGMYRVVTLSLAFLVAVSLLFSIIGNFPYNPFEILLSLVVTIGVALGVNILFANILRIPVNNESAVITALIVFFLIVPSATLTGHWVIALVTAIAIASKFIIVWRKQHIFNAAAIGALALTLPSVTDALWWIGTPELFIPLVVVGSFVVMKIRKWPMVLWCIGLGFAVYVFEDWRLGLLSLDSIKTFFLSWPLLFLAFFMLTEPFTMPPTKKLQALYGALVGGLSSAAFFAPFITMSPELALIIANLVFYPFTLRKKVYAQLIRSSVIAKDTFEFIFSRPKGVSFKAGQYFEWMLPHKSAGDRGTRRYFTIASAPHEDHLCLVVRFYENGSTYKNKLKTLKPGEYIIASQRAGDFLLPSDTSKKLVFVAGGVGVTPFLSHLKDIQHKQEKRDITLFYCNNYFEDIAYQEMFNSMVQEDLCKVVYILSEEEKSGYEHGFITKEMIDRHTPDYLERIWYLSGPPAMVYAYTNLLKKLGVPNKNIIRDFFPGLV